MSVYYIVKIEGLFKKYYTNSDNPSSTHFVSSVRAAYAFTTIEEAKKLLGLDILNNCMIIDQYGQIQKKV